MLCGCKVVNQSPNNTIFDPIWGYFHCHKCGSLDGGVYMKSGVKSLRTEKGYNCWHNWREIEQEEFNRLYRTNFPTEFEAEKKAWNELKINLNNKKYK